MKKIVFSLSVLLVTILSNASSSPNGDYVCTVRVRTSSGDVVISTAASDISYQDACKKAYAQAMQSKSN
ncbi:MAG: hypothetical protein RMJ97_10060 [Raineya sp.]|nr:hypothetical protein [Raineya sp.]